MSGIAEYKMVKCRFVDDVELFNDEINALINEGWLPHWGPFVAINLICQAMVIYKKPDDEQPT